MRKMSKVRFNTKLIVDVIGATLIVQQAPKLLSSVLPVSPELETAVGVGAGYLAGSFFKRPDLANAAIGIGVVSFVAPMVENLLGGGSGSVPPALPPAGGTKAVLDVMQVKRPALDDYLSLNDYTNNPANQLTFSSYRDSY
ncbi:MAG: hypothetical protein IPM51_12180 [Sphingobacteriaceae bacterium]|nr:hypothetical protein [Sphingobacteriaceae bacterium]